VILIGQSLELSRARVLGPMRHREPGPVADAVRRQVEAGAGMIDLNGGVHADADDLAWCARVAWDALPSVPLFMDTASPLMIAQTLEACRRAGIIGPLVANSLVADADGRFNADARTAIDAAILVGAGVVLSPRGADDRGAGDPASAEAIAAAGLRALQRARDAGVAGPWYLDALAYPPLSDPVRCARSLAVLRAWRSVGEAAALVAVGNVGYGAARPLAAALRAVYAAAATGAGAGALILPVEEATTLRAVRIASAELEPATDEDRWFAAVALAARLDQRPVGAPEGYEQAARLVFGG
ncbi:MAG: hypothetical protein WCI61_10190, partial [Chloroflexota bacterium]